MEDARFKNWLKNKYSKKISTDIVSRIRRVERYLETSSIEDEYEKDKCAFVLSIFENKGINERMRSLGKVDLPVGKYYLSTYRHAIERYIRYRTEIAGL